MKIELKIAKKSTFIFLKLLKIEQKWNGRFRTRRINRSLFHETEIYFIQPKFICWIVVHFMKSKFIYSIEAYLLNQSLFCEIEIYLFNWNLFYEIKIYLFNQNLLFSIEVYLWNLCQVYWIELNFLNLSLFFKSKFNFNEPKFIFDIQIRLIKWEYILSNQSLSYPSVTKKKIIAKVCSVFAVESNWQMRGLFVLVAEQKKNYINWR